MKRSFSMSQALGDGLGLIVRRPLAVLIWGLLMWLPSVASLGSFGPMWQSGMWESGAADPDFGLNELLTMSAWSNLANALSLVVSAIIGAAVIRVVLNRRLGAYGGLRLGVAEFYYILVQVVITVGLCLVMALIVGLGIALSVALRGLPDAPRIAAWVVLWLVVLLAVLWLWARTALISVITVQRRELAFEAGWAATRGRVVKLVVMGLISLILSGTIFFLIALVACLPLIGMGVFADWSSWSDWDNVMRLTDIGLGTGFALAFGVLGLIVATGAATVVSYAPWASAWRQLDQGEPENLTEAS